MRSHKKEEIAMQEDGSQNAQSRRPEEPQHTPRQHAPQKVDQAEDEGPIETPAVNPTPDDRNPIGK
jgi:hypothetical protein